MRRANFFISALVAVATYALLSAFVGRPWSGRHYHCYYSNGCGFYDHRENDRNTTGNAPFRDSVPIQ